MTNKIGIGVEAQFDTGKVEQQINSLGQRVAQANKVQYSPVSGKTTAELAKILQQFDQLRRVQGDLNRRMKNTGQDGAGLLDVDWDKLYPDQHSRSRQMRKAFEYSVGNRFSQSGPPSPGDPHPGRPQQPGGPTWGRVAQGAAQAGLRAAGPAGGVAANALGTGMSAGFGAGLMGLVGGVVALGVGKLVSGVMEKIDQAEANNVALDKLKRNLGDVNVSFNALKAVVHGSADNLKITYAEAGQLASQFVKLGNVTADQYKTISDELGVGVGMSRAFGMDPGAGVGVMGQMRGLGVTSNTQESRRFALLIGETIGKSNAFAKSEEVMEALANYATSQTRNNLGRANVEGYAGMYSAMVGSGIPGLDPSGAGALLARINASLSAGGAKGEASQFFTGSIGSSMGLNPYQTRMLREGGAFATADGMFGKDSAYAAYKKLKPGDARPTGSATFLQSSLDKLRAQYGEGSDELADATANHLGIGINQAMGLLSLKPNQMGGLSKKYGDLTKFSSVANLAKIEFGTADDRKAVAKNLLGRTGADAISGDDRRAIQGADTDEKLKTVLGQIASKYDQERTIGSDIRDSKNVLDNIKTNLADKLVPIANEMRHGIMYMAGVKDGKSPREIMEAVLKAEGKDKIAGVSAEEGNKVINARSRLDAVNKKKEELTLEYRKQYGKFTNNPDEYHRQMKELAAMEEFATRELNKAKTEYAKAIKDAKQEVEDSMTDHKLGLAPGTTSGKRLARESAQSGGTQVGPAAAGGTKIGDTPTGGKQIDTSTLDGKLAEAERRNGLPPGTLKSVIKQETGGKQEYLDDPSKYHYPLNADGRRVAGHTGKISTAFGPFGILESTAKRPGYGVAPLKDKGIDEQVRFASEYLAARSRSAGSIEGGLAGYGEGSRYSRSVMSRLPKGGGTPIPEGAGAGRGSVNPEYRVSADDITVRVVDANGKPIAPAQQITTRVSATRPFGVTAQ